MANFIISELAKKDITDIWNYTASEWSEEQAIRYYNGLLDTCERIATNPEIVGRSYDEVRPGLRGVNCGRLCNGQRVCSQRPSGRGGRFFGNEFDPKDPPEYIKCFHHFKLGRNYLLQTQNLDIYGVAQEYQGPVCIIHGSRDGIVPLWCSEKYKAIYSEARMTVQSRKIFKADMKECDFIDKSILSHYGDTDGGFHTVYVIEIEKVFTAE